MSRTRMHQLWLAALAVAVLAPWAQAQTTSVASGDWNDPATWSTNQVPSATDDVIIDADHVVVLGDVGNCRNFSFAATSAKLDLGDAAAVLNVYGDFSFAAANHLAFAGWTEGARVRFTGDAPVQRLINLSTSASTGTTRFDDLVVDKAAGKLTTGDELGVGGDLRLRIGRSLDIVSGTFELASTDDIEGRDSAGNAATPDILVRAEGIFEMVGGASHIRRGTFTGADTAKIGTLQVWGLAALNSGSTLRTNFTAVVIEDGGEIQYSTGKSTISNSFNPGTLTIRDGGSFRNSITTAYWYENTTTPNALVVESGGSFRTSSGTTALPQSVTIDGEIRFLGSQAQTIPAELPAVIGTLAVSNEGVKTLASDVTVQDGLIVFGQAQLATGGFTLTYGPGAVLTYGGDGQISPQTTSSEEFPASGGPAAIVVHNETGVTLHEDRTITGTLTIETGNLLTGGFEITLADGATLIEAEGASVLGLVRATRTLGASGQDEFGGMGLTITAADTAPGVTTVVRRSGVDLAPFGVPRHYDIVPTQNAGLGATLTVRYTAAELGSIPEGNLGLFRSEDDGLNWNEEGGTVDTLAKTVTLGSIDSFSLWALGDTDPATSVGNVPSIVTLEQNYPNPFNPQTTIAFSLPSAGDVTLSVHDLRGRLVRTLVSGAMDGGRHEVTWDGRDAQGSATASGLYLVRLATADGSSRTMKVTLAK